MSKPKKILARQYSGFGKHSKEFWKRINSLPRSESSAVYIAGCLLQDVEGRVLQILNDAENRRRGPQ